MRPGGRSILSDLCKVAAPKNRELLSELRETGQTLLGHLSRPLMTVSEDEFEDDYD
jgi:hypothetical protein